MSLSDLVKLVLYAVMASVVATAVFVSNGYARQDQSQFKGHRVGSQSWQWQTDVWLPDKHRRVAICETGQNPPNWRHDSGTYQGGYGFYHGTWDGFKPVAWWPSNAAQATPWQQYRTALRVIARFGWSGWGCRGA